MRSGYEVTQSWRWGDGTQPWVPVPRLVGGGRAAAGLGGGCRRARRRDVRAVVGGRDVGSGDDDVFRWFVGGTGLVRGSPRGGAEVAALRGDDPDRRRPGQRCRV